MQESVRRTTAGGGKLKGSGRASRPASPGRVTPPVVVLKDDDTRLHAFGTVELLVAHAQDHGFSSAGWRLFDVTGTELETVDSGSGISGVSATASKEHPNQLARRMKNVMKTVEDRVEESPPDPESGIEVSSLSELRSLPYDQLLNQLVELFWGASDAEDGTGSIAAPRPVGTSAVQSSGPAAKGSVAGTGTTQGTGPKGHQGPDAITTGTKDPDPNTRGWWHNMWGH